MGYLTSRNIERGNAAVKQLEGEGLTPKYHQLDISSPESIDALHKFIMETYGGVDVLVNNAGVYLLPNDPTPFVEKLNATMDINWTGTLNMCKTFLPSMRPGGRVVNVSSELGSQGVRSVKPEMRAKLLDPDITLEQLEGFLKLYHDTANTGGAADAGFTDDPNGPYCMSKLGLIVLSMIYGKQASQDIIVNSCDPGYVDTDMTRKFPRPLPVPKVTAEEGADTPVHLSLLPPKTASPQGRFIVGREDFTQKFHRGRMSMLEKLNYYDNDGTNF